MDECLVCRCEEVDAAQVQEALERGRSTPRALKLGTRAGMGACQGRVCRSVLQRLAGEAGEGNGLTHRPPVRPVAVADILAPAARSTAAAAAPTRVLPMSDMRITEHPILGPAPERRVVAFTWNGSAAVGLEGEPIAAALLALGQRALRRSARLGQPRGIYCNIGHCYECRVTVDGVRGLRACLTPLREGMKVESE